MLLINMDDLSPLIVYGRLVKLSLLPSNKYLILWEDSRDKWSIGHFDPLGKLSTTMEQYTELSVAVVAFDNLFTTIKEKQLQGVTEGQYQMYRKTVREWTPSKEPTLEEVAILRMYNALIQTYERVQRYDTGTA